LLLPSVGFDFWQWHPSHPLKAENERPLSKAINAFTIFFVAEKFQSFFFGARSTFTCSPQLKEQRSSAEHQLDSQHVLWCTTPSCVGQKHFFSTFGSADDATFLNHQCLVEDGNWKFPVLKYEWGRRFLERVRVYRH